MSSKSSFYNSTGVTNTQSNAIDASVDNAEASATASENSANSASASASTATTKASEASTSASTATTKASEASTSASTATTKASESASSATASANSETAASNSSSTATTKASEASSSASTALSHKNAAQTAKTAAETAETNAETAETNAASSATSASNSASSASTSASTATTKAGEAATSATASANSATASANSATASANSATAAANSAASITGAETNAANSATAASASKDAALAALDNFDDRYLGVKSSNPSVDNDLNALVAGSLYFNSTDDTMKVYEGSNWVAAYASVSGAVLKTGSTMTGNLSFGNNDKAIFGTGSALQIFHDGTKSIIADAGTGNLQLRANDFQLLNAAGSQNIIRGYDSTGGVGLHFGGGEKLATTSTGIDVTGTVTSDGLTVDGDITATGDEIVLNSSTQSFLKLDKGSSNNFALTRYYTAGTEEWRTGTYSDGTSYVIGTPTAKKLLITTGGDISFYEDTGTTAKFFWDASAESLGIGRTDPNRQLSIQNPLANGGGQIGLTSSDSSTSGSLGIIHFGNSTDSSLASIGGIADGSTSAGALVFKTEAAGGSIEERMRLTSDGSLLLSGVGGLTTTGGNNLTVSGSVANHAGLIFATHAILPAEEGAEASPNVIDIGANGNEFKNLYLDTSIISSNALSITTGTTLTLDAAGDITLDADGSEVFFADGGTNFLKIQNDSGTAQIRSLVSDGDIQFIGNDNGSAIVALTLDMSDAGTAIFNNKVGIGIVPQAELHVHDPAGHAKIRLSGAASNADTFEIYQGITGVTNGGLTIRDVEASADRLVIDSSGKVGISTSSPSSFYSLASNLVVGTGSGGNGITIYSGSSDSGYIGFNDTASNAMQAFIQYNHNGNYMAFAPNGSEKMRIDSSGNVGIAVSSPSAKIEVDTNVGSSSTGTLARFHASKGESDSTFLQIAATRHGTASVQRVQLQAFDDDGSTGRTLALNPSGGSVGVGTNSPSTKLTILANSANGIDLAQDPDDGTNSGRLFFTTSGGSNSIRSTSGALQFSTGATAGSSSGTERMRIDSSGRLLLGTTTSFADGNSDDLQIAGSGNTGMIIKSGSSNYGSIYFGDATSGDARNAGIVRYFHNDNSMQFWTNESERMRIDSSGNLLVGKNTTHSGVNGTVLYNNGQIYSTATGHQVMLLSRYTNNGEIILFYRDGTNVGNIYVTTSSTSYNTSSDYRLKENVVNLTGASARVNQLNPSRFNFITDDTNTLVDGFLAHEVATVVPEAITGAKDAMKDEEYEVTAAVLDDDGNVTTEAVMGTRNVPDYQGIDQSKLVPLLTAALQEALAKIDAMETRLIALEG